MDIKLSFEDFSSKHLNIRAKSGKITQLIWTHEQRLLNEYITQLHKQNNKCRLVVLKSRQVGISTYFLSYLYFRMLYKLSTRGLVLAHTEVALSNFYNIMKNFYQLSHFFFRFR